MATIVIPFPYLIVTVPKVPMAFYEVVSIVIAMGGVMVVGGVDVSKIATFI